MKELLLNPQFTSNSSVDYQRYGPNTEAYTLTNNQTIAGSITSFDWQETIVNREFRIQFYIRNSSDPYAEETYDETIWVNAIYCTDKYKAEIEAEAADDYEGDYFYTIEYLNTSRHWVCPEIDST